MQSVDYNRRVTQPARRFPLTLAFAAALLATTHAQPPQSAAVAAIQTVPEKTGFNDTSKYADVVAFLEAIDKASPAVHLTTFGTTNEQRALPLAVIGAPAATPEAVKRTGKLRVYIQGNIHGGEVEGKESAQMLLRDLAAGKHDDWLKSMVFLIAPIYNADGNERFALNNRGPQYGPIGGQGQRPNAQGLDLNRDHMKLDSPEARAFVKLMNDYDPHVGMDLHTTNGTRHAYHLTYSPPLHPATDPAIIDLLRKEWFPRVTTAIRDKYGWEYLLLRQSRRGRRRRGAAPAAERRWEIVRPPAPLQQQLHRPAQSLRPAERGLRLHQLQGPHPRDQPVRRREPRVHARQCRADQEARRRVRPGRRRRETAAAPRRARPHRDRRGPDG